MDEALLKRLSSVIRYCRGLAAAETSLTAGVDISTIVRKQVALEILYMLGEDVTNCEGTTLLNYTSGNSERDKHDNIN